MNNYSDRLTLARIVGTIGLLFQLLACGGAGVSGEAGSAPGTPTIPQTGADTVNPSITITSPTSAATHTTASPSITLGGNAGDNVGVTRVSWTNDQGGSGGQNFTSASVNWSFSVAVQPGANVLTVTARDAVGNTRTDQLTITRTTATNIAALSWDANTESDLIGYRVYYGTSPGNYQQARGAGIEVTGTSSHTVTGLTSGGRYYFAVTAFDASGNESAYSREVSKDIP